MLHVWVDAGGWDPATGTYKQAGVHGPNPSMLPGYTAPGAEQDLLMSLSPAECPCCLQLLTQ